MAEALRRVEERYAELETLLSDPAVATDPRRLRDLSRERARLQETVNRSAEYREVARTIADDEQAAASGDAELAELANAELPGLREREAALGEQLKKLLLPRDPDDDKNVIVEIRAGTGGDEAALFAGDLYRMYSKYADARGWKHEVMSLSEAAVGGYKEVIFTLEGESVYREMKFESGVHRVQRVPATEASGRIHTSAATVAVLPEVEDVDVDIREEDLRVDVYRSGGKGGQGVNTTDSAVRITHLPTGVVVTCQDERSQIKNRAKAMKVLRARLYDAKLAEAQAKYAAQRKSQVSTGDRSAKIRTYNFPQGRVTDHRINFTLHSLANFMEGEIGEMTEALVVADAAERLAALAGGGS
ncbi:MAG: peptide chain release factor 1 [Candidatus Eisenbacteria bacterium]|nr:peptide chain release factor 1 [Candidatus Eisenbacteria bacterium]